mmetsp:Transcript_5064/g.11773  ORF Transcript_5064/g.11773 Transcript_5064/m.11773 type:complete len:575 (-) Transcript_5064:229-1953(-)
MSSAHFSFLVILANFASCCSASVSETLPGSSAFLSVGGPLTPDDLLLRAADETLGMGHGVGLERLQVIRDTLSTSWRSLPKSYSGRVDRGALGYALNRYFMKTYSLSVMGLEMDVNGTITEAEQDPYLSEVSSFFAQMAPERSFSFEEGVAAAVMIEELIANFEREILEEVYEQKEVQGTLSDEELDPIMRSFTLNWLLHADPVLTVKAEKHPSSVIEEWPSVLDLLDGIPRNSKYFSGTFSKKASEARKVTGGISNPMSVKYDFEDVHNLMRDFTRSFGNYTQIQCDTVRAKLTKMDTSNTGRVPLATFHKAALDGDWHFSESLTYLRHLGAVDESSAWHGPRVIIPNYIQSASNCLVAAADYRVCCQTQCESYMDVFEAAVEGPTAEPDVILALTAKIIEENSEGQFRFPSSLRQQLLKISRANHGRVPLHGRLFAQWLHYAFPSECPFPHVSGSVDKYELPPNFERALASTTEMRKNAAARVPSMKAGARPQSRSNEEESDWMTHWIHEEELISQLHLQAPWEATALPILKNIAGAICFLVVLSGIVYVFGELRRVDVLRSSIDSDKLHFI